MEIEASSVSETTRRDASVPGRCVQRKFTPAPIWTSAMLAALQTGVKGGKWHSLIDKVSRLETLKMGWVQVERNAGAAGVDRMSVTRFAQAKDRYLAELARGLRDGSYCPQPVRRVYIPKGKGQRPLGIPAVKDRVVQAALKLVIGPIFEREFVPRSYGFRPGLGCKDALREVDQYLKAGYFWVVDADLQSYFDTIPHAPLLAKVGRRIDEAHRGSFHRRRDCVAQPDSERLVWLLQTCPPFHLLVNRRFCSSPLASVTTPAEAPTRSRTMPERSQTMAECLLRRSWTVHDGRGPSIGAPIPMRKQLTGEPVAGELHTGFGGRGWRAPFPTPILGRLPSDHPRKASARSRQPCLSHKPTDDRVGTPVKWRSTAGTS